VLSQLQVLVTVSILIILYIWILCITGLCLDIADFTSYLINWYLMNIFPIPIVIALLVNNIVYKFINLGNFMLVIMR